MVDKRMFIPKNGSQTIILTEEKVQTAGRHGFSNQTSTGRGDAQCYQQRKLLPFKYVLADSLYGTSPEFIQRRSLAG
jgi:SRSO17 transposase